MNKGSIVFENISFNLNKISDFTDREKFEMYMNYLESEITNVLESIESCPIYDNIHEMKNLFVSFYPNEFVLNEFSKYEEIVKQKTELNMKEFKQFVGYVYYKLKNTLHL